jgi:sterol desaturase/sphingolipid hydroxylase (fatty acid hydroxylase superfamily)
MEATPKKAYLSNENVSPVLFQNKWLDKLTRTHIAIPVSLFFIYSAGLLYYTQTSTDLSLPMTIALFLGGLLLFTFVEYHVHKGVYHMEPTTERKAKIQYTMHGIHHDYPKDKQRLAMPPAMSVLIATILLVIFRVILGKFAFAFLAGFLVGYAMYLIVHYMVHIFRPPNNIIKALWVNHSIHHYSPEEVMFGVSSPLWDYIYGTTPKRRGIDVTEVKVESNL